MKIGGSVQFICLFSLNTALLIAALTSSHPDLVEGTLSVITFCHEPLWIEEYLPAHGRASALTYCLPCIFGTSQGTSAE